MALLPGWDQWRRQRPGSGSSARTYGESCMGSLDNEGKERFFRDGTGTHLAMALEDHRSAKSTPRFFSAPGLDTSSIQLAGLVVGSGLRAGGGKGAYHASCKSSA